MMDTWAVSKPGTKLASGLHSPEDATIYSVRCSQHFWNCRGHKREVYFSLLLCLLVAVLISVHWFDTLLGQVVDGGDLDSV